MRNGLCYAFSNWKMNKLRRFDNTIAQCTLVNASKTVFAQFTNARSFHRGFYKWKMIDNDQKSLFRNWLLILKFLHCLPILVRCKTIAGQCQTSTWPTIPDWTLMPECRFRTEAADYRKKWRCRTNFFPAFRLCFTTADASWFSPSFYCSVRSTSMACLAEKRIEP